MTRSDTIGKLAEALAAAQGEMAGAAKDSENPHFRSRYADLASVVDAIKGPLSAHGLAYIQTTEPSERQEVVVVTTLVHISGEWVSGTLALPVTKADAQGFGSCLTYARRYALAAICGVAPEDDDGNAATKAAPKAESENPYQPKRKDVDDMMRRVQDEAGARAASWTPPASPPMDPALVNRVLGLAGKVDDRHGAGTTKAIRLGLYPDSRGVATLSHSHLQELQEALQAKLEEPVGAPPAPEVPEGLESPTDAQEPAQTELPGGARTHRGRRG